MSVGKLTGPKKAAILLLSLGEDAAADVMKNLEESEIQQVGYLILPIFRCYMLANQTKCIISKLVIL